MSLVWYPITALGSSAALDTDTNTIHLRDQTQVRFGSLNQTVTVLGKHPDGMRCQNESFVSDTKVACFWWHIRQQLLDKIEADRTYSVAIVDSKWAKESAKLVRNICETYELIPPFPNSFPTAEGIEKILHARPRGEFLKVTHVDLPLTEAIDKALWGTYGPNGKDVLSWKRLMDLDTEHLHNLLGHPTCSNDYRRLINHILKRRNDNVWMKDGKLVDLPGPIGRPVG